MSWTLIVTMQTLSITIGNDVNQENYASKETKYLRRRRIEEQKLGHIVSEKTLLREYASYRNSRKQSESLKKF